MAELATHTHPAKWIGVRDKSEYRFRLSTLAPAGGSVDPAASPTPGKQSLTIDPPFPAAGEYIDITDCPGYPALVGMWLILEVIPGPSHVVLVIDRTEDAPPNEPFDYYFPIVSGITPRLYAARQDTPVPDEGDLIETALGKVSANLADRYYTVNVAEFLKAHLQANPSELLGSGNHLYTPYYLEIDTGTEVVPIGGIHYAMDSMIPDLAPYHTFGYTQKLLSPSGNTLPYWEGFDTVIGYIYKGNTGEQKVISNWLSYNLAAQTFNVIVDEANEIDVPVTFVKMDCPKYPNAVQVVWRNPQGAWSTWVFGYNNETFDEIEEGEPYTNTAGETIAQGVVAYQRMVLYSGFLNRELWLNLLKTLRYSEHVYVRALGQNYRTPSLQRANITRGSFKLKDADSKRFEVNCELTFAKQIYT